MPVDPVHCMPTRDECKKLNRAALVQMCKTMKVRGFSNKTKDWLVENCCVSTSLPMPEMQSKMAEERQRRENLQYTREERERERLSALNADIDSIKPSGNVKTPSMYKEKNIEWQTIDINHLKDVGEIVGPNPVYTGFDPFNYCPESIDVLANIIKSGALYGKQFPGKVDVSFNKVSIGKLPGDDGMIVNRADPRVDLLVMDNQKIGIEKMQVALKSRFRPYHVLKSSRCFDVEKSASGNYYGIFLKH